MNSIGLAVCWLVGCALGVALLSDHPRGINPAYGLALMAVALVFFLLSMAARSERSALWSFLFVGMALAACGNALLRHHPVTASSLAYYSSAPSAEPVVLIGTVAAEPLVSDRSQRLRVAVSEIRLPRQSAARPVTGDLLALVSRYPEHEVGERLVLSGTLQPPPSGSDFDYASYLARQGVYSYMAFPRVRSLGPGSQGTLQSMVSDVRAEARSALRRLLPEPESALAIGVVVGDRTSMSEELQDQFSRSGTIHVLAVSGQNISLLVGFVWLLVKGGNGHARMPWRLLAVVLVLLFAYTLFTGATASVVRAAIMSAVLLLAPVLGRRYDPVAALAVSAVMMTAFTPALIFDAGFDLSFGAMLGIGILAPPIQLGLSRLRMPGWLTAALATGLGAQAMTMPLVLLLTGRLSLVSPLATLSIDAALLPLMVLGILAVAGSFTLLGPLAALFGWLAWFPAEWMVFSVRFWSSLPFAALDLGPVDARLAGVYYALLLVACLAFTNRRAITRKAAHVDRAMPALAIAGTGALALWAVFIWLVLLR